MGAFLFYNGGQDVCVDAVMDSLDFGQDGDDATDFDNDTKEKMNEAEHANARVSK